MRNYEEEIKARVAFIQKKMEQAHADGLVFGNSGGKDSALVGILCSMATKNLQSATMAKTLTTPPLLQKILA